MKRIPWQVYATGAVLVLFVLVAAIPQVREATGALVGGLFTAVVALLGVKGVADSQKKRRAAREKATAADVEHAEATLARNERVVALNDARSAAETQAQAASPPSDPEPQTDAEREERLERLRERW